MPQSIRSPLSQGPQENTSAHTHEVLLVSTRSALLFDGTPSHTQAASASAQVTLFALAPQLPAHTHACANLAHCKYTRTQSACKVTSTRAHNIIHMDTPAR